MITYYTVTFNVQGHGTAPQSQSVTEGGKVTKPDNPSATGYYFAGWYKEAACTNAWNFTSETVSADTTLYAKWLTIISVPSPQSLIYTGEKQTGVASGTGYTRAGTYEATGAGGYTAVAKISGNYCWNASGDVADKNIQWSIGKATLTATADDKTAVYGDDPPTYTFTYSGFVHGETESVVSGQPQCTCGYQKWSSAGQTFPISISVVDLSATNYKFTGAGGTLTVVKADYDMSGVSFDDITPVYNGQSQRPAVSGTLPTGHDGIQVTVSYTGSATHVDDGEVTVTATFSTQSTNYNAPAAKTATVTVCPKEVSLAWSGDQLTYNGYDQKPSAAAGSLVQGDECNVTVVGEQSSAGDHTATAFELDNTDYKLPALVTHPFVIAKVDFGTEVELTLLQSSSVYNAQVLDPGYTVMFGDLALLISDYTAVWSPAEIKDAGEYTLTVTSTGGNFTAGSHQAVYTVVPQGTGADMVLSDDPTYDGAQHTIQVVRATIDGVDIDDYELMGDITATEVGDYYLILKGKGNFTGTVMKKWSILRASMSDQTVDVGPVPCVYDGTVKDPAVTVSLAVQLPESDYTVSWSSAVLKDAGTYTVTVTAAGGNMIGGTSNTATFTILPKDISEAEVVLGDALTYNGAEQTMSVLRATVDGLDISPLNVSDDTGTAAGEYALTITGSGNFIGTVMWQWTIEKASIADQTIDVGLDSRVYDGTVKEPEVTVSLKVPLPESDYTLSWSGEIKDAGEYTLTVAAAGDNMKNSSSKISLTILQKQVTVTADDLSKVYGERDPALTATVVGTIGSDRVEYSVSRAAGENPGTYAITVSGTASQGNYTVTFVPGTFTIESRDFTVSFDMNGRGTAPDDQTVEVLKWAIRPTDPHAEGYTFSGWFKDAALTVPWDFPADRITGDTVIYAKWTVNTALFKVSFDTMGHGLVPLSRWVAYGGLVTEPDVPSATGFVFSGWFREKSLVNIWDFDSDCVTSDTVLYAKWTGENVPVENVSISIGSTVIGYGADHVTAHIILDPVDATPSRITWTSSDRNVVRAEMEPDGSARIVPVGIGTAVVTVTVDGKTSSVTLTVAFSPSAIDQSGKVAVIDNEEAFVEEIRQSPGSRPSVALDLTEKDSIEISKDLIDTVRAKGGTIAVTTVDGQAVLDPSALGKLTEEKVTIGVKRIGTHGTVPDASVAVDVSVTVNGSEKPVSFDEPVLIGIAHTLACDEDVNSLTVYCVKDDGTVEIIEGGYYADGRVYFYAPHFSVYAAVFGTMPDDGVSLYWYLIQVIAAAIVTEWAVIPRRHKD